MGTIITKLARDMYATDARLQPDGSYLDNEGDIIWYNEEGAWHNDDGPAIIKSDGQLWWYLNDKEYVFKKWLALTQASDETKMLLRLQYA
jgi:hypothetical protein